VGAEKLHRMSGVIAGDEGWHARAYRTFVEKFLEIDTNEAVIAIGDLFRKQIRMPAMNLREGDAERGSSFKVFEALAQRIKVYTALDYLEILEFLVDHWKIADLSGLSAEAEKAQAFICKLPGRYRKLLTRNRIPTAEELPPTFRWLTPALAA